MIKEDLNIESSPISSFSKISWKNISADYILMSHYDSKMQIEEESKSRWHSIL